MSLGAVLPVSFFDRDTLDVARDLIGKRLVYHHSNGTLCGLISETEAYTQEDPACHAFKGRQTPRNKIMFGPPGHAYIYFIYGMYHCLNVVTEAQGRGCAVLIRSVIPEDGVDLFRQHRPHITRDSDLANGPGKLMMAYDIPSSFNGVSLCDVSNPLQLLESNFVPTDIRETSRIGIREGADLPWRFCLAL